MNVKSLNGSRPNSIPEGRHQLIVLMMLLNSADAFFTSLALDFGVAEANPIMAATLKLGMTWFLFNKLIIVNLLILFLGSIGKDYHVGRRGLVFVACIYTVLTLYHMINLCHLMTTSR